jgi:hypothetical protein
MARQANSIPRIPAKKQLKRSCRHCGAKFFPEPFKPGFIDECPNCLAARGQFSIGPNPSDIRPQTLAPPPFSLPPAVRRINARFPGRCHRCRLSFDAGAEILWSTGVKTVWHEVCYRAAQLADFKRQQSRPDVHTHAIDDWITARSKDATASGPGPKRRGSRDGRISQTGPNLSRVSAGKPAVNNAARHQSAPSASRVQPVR